MVTVVEEGDIFKSKAQTLVNTVNTVGVMGKGIALGFRRRFPDMFEDYAARCARGEVRLGKPYLYRRTTPPWILNFPTKGHWRSVARLDAIVEGLRHLERNYRAWGITSLAVPPLGCGEGQLEWRVVGPTLVRHLTRLQVPVELYAPFGTPHEELQPSYLVQLSLETSDREHPISRVPSAWVALVDILREVQRDRYHWPVGRITFEKLAYFATQVGIDTGLSYKRSSFGPWAEGGKRVRAQLINNGLITERQHGRMFRVDVGATFRDAANVFEKELTEYRPAIEHVADLLRRMKTRQAEIAATVHFAAKELNQQGGPPTELDVLGEVLQWKARRIPPFSDQEVAETIRNLALLGWINVAPSSELTPDDHIALA